MPSPGAARPWWPICSWTRSEDLSAFDALVVSSGSRWAPEDPQHDLLASPEALELVRRAHVEGLVVGAWCNGVYVLAEAGVLDGVQVTGNARDRTVAEDAGAVWVDDSLPPIWDGGVLTTSRGNTQRLINTEGLLRAIRLNREVVQ